MANFLVPGDFTILEETVLSPTSIRIGFQYTGPETMIAAGFQYGPSDPGLFPTGSQPWGYANTGVVSGSGTTRTVTFDPLIAPGNTLHYMPFFINILGNIYGPGDLTFNIPALDPDQVTGVTQGAVTDSSVVLTWSSAANATGYEVHRALIENSQGEFKKINASAVVGLTYTDNAVNSTEAPETGATYAYKVRGIN